MPYAFSVASHIEDEPENLQEAMRSQAMDKWDRAMTEEMEYLRKNNTWTLVRKPNNQKLIGFKCIFKRKQGIPGVEELRYGARPVAKWLSQIEGIDFHEVLSAVVK